MSTLLSNTIKPRRGNTVTFTDNVSIGGTVTYEDVSNVDSVGIITSQSGIKVGAGQSISPESGTIAYYGDGSNLDGIEFGTRNFVASGTLPNGTPVIINTDGTVGIVTMVTSDTPSVGITTVFEEKIVFCSPSSIVDVGSGKVVIAYSDRTQGLEYGYGKAVVGTINGDTIDFGAYGIFYNAWTDEMSIVYDSTNDKVVVAFNGNNKSEGRSCLGTVTGTGITFSSPVPWEFGDVDFISAAYDSTHEKVIVAYRDHANGPYWGTISVQTVDVANDTITIGNEVTFEESATEVIRSTFDSTNEVVVISYVDDGDSAKGKLVVVTPTGGAGVQCGSAVTFNDNTTQYHRPIHDPINNKIVVVYTDNGNSPGKGTVRVGTVGGTGVDATITFGSEYVFYDLYLFDPMASYDSANEKIVIGYQNNNSTGPWNGLAIVGEVTVGSGFTWGTETAFNSVQINEYSSTYDSTNEKVVFVYRDVVNSNYATAVSFNSVSIATNLTSENYIGISGESISNGATGKINITGGINSGQTGLTTAQKYYVGQTGILTTTADTPSVVAGTSISDTKIVIK